MSRSAAVSESITSPLAKCREGSNEVTVCGNKFDSLKKEKKAVKYSGLYHQGYSKVSQDLNRFSIIDMLISLWTTGCNGLLFLIDF